jgi:flagellar protein FliS
VNGYVNPSAARLYHQGQVAHAEPADLIVLLYDGAIQRVRQASEGIAKNNPLIAGIAIYRVLAIIGELRRSLNMELGGEFAERLDALYQYMHEELVRGHLERRADRVDAVGGLMVDLREAWAEAAKQLKAQQQPEPAMAAAGAECGAPRIFVKA